VIRYTRDLVISDYAILFDEETETKFLRFTLRLGSQDGGGFEHQHISNFERLKQPFAIGNWFPACLIIAAGYEFNEFLVWCFGGPKSTPPAPSAADSSFFGAHRRGAGVAVQKRWGMRAKKVPTKPKMLRFAKGLGPNRERDSRN